VLPGHLGCKRFGGSRPVRAKRPDAPQRRSHGSQSFVEQGVAELESTHSGLESNHRIRNLAHSGYLEDEAEDLGEGYLRAGALFLVDSPEYRSAVAARRRRRASNGTARRSRTPRRHPDTDQHTQTDTTLRVHPFGLNDFDDDDQFLDEADALLAELRLQGAWQVASFHPRCRFAGTASDDIGNATNRSPYPPLQLLRESSVERALAACPQAERLFEASLQTLACARRDGARHPRPTEPRPVAQRCAV
jgi:hypothetical protein